MGCIESGIPSVIIPSYQFQNSPQNPHNFQPTTYQQNTNQQNTNQVWSHQQHYNSSGYGQVYQRQNNSFQTPPQNSPPQNQYFLPPGQLTQTQNLNSKQKQNIPLKKQVFHDAQVKPSQVQNKAKPEKKVLENQSAKVNPTPNIIVPKQMISNLPDQDTFINQILGLITKSRQLQCVLTSELFQIFPQYYERNYWLSDNKQQLITILLNYIKFCTSLLSKSQKNQTKYTLEQFGQNFGRDLYKIITMVQMKKIWTIQTVRYGLNFMKKRFSLQNNQEILGMTDQVENLCSKSTSGLVYLSYYLVKCCRDLEKKNMPPSKINEKLKPIVVSLKQKFSPENTLKQQLKYNTNRSFEQDEVNKIPSMNIPYKKRVFTFKTANKEEEMVDFIMEMVELGKKHFSTFTKLTSVCCLQNGGLNYKSNLKLKQRSQTMPVLRVKEKLLGDFINQHYKGKTYDSDSIDSLQKAEIQYLQQSLKKVYDKMDSIQFIVTDILRGKCMFNKIREINAAAKQIMKTVEIRASKGQDIQVVSIDNRLMKITKDLMLRIRIQGIVCEFQIALKFNQAQNQIHHKMYEVERSKVFSPVTMLFNWHESISKQFFGEADKILQKCEEQNKDKKQLIQLLKNIKNFMNFKTAQNSGKQIPTIVSKRDLQYFNRIKFEINNMVVPQQLYKKIYIRTGIVMYEIKSIEYSLANLQKHKQEHPEDFDVYIEVGYVLNRKGKYKESLQNLMKYFGRLDDNTAINQTNLRLIHKSVVEIINCFQKLGRYKIAAKDILEPIHGDLYLTHFDINGKQYAKYLSLYARINTKLSKFKEAEQLFEKSIAIYEKINNAEDKDPDDPNYHEVYLLFADLYLQKDIFSKALELLSKSQSIAENIFGKESLEVGQVILKMGQAYEKMGRFQEALSHLKKYQKLAETLMTRNSTQYVTSQMFLAKLFIGFHQAEKAREILEQCSQISSEIWQQQSLQQAQLANCFGKLLVQQRRYQQALQSFQKALDLVLKIQQQGNTIATYYNNVALCYQILKNIEEAKNYYQKQQNIIKQNSGQDSIQLALCYNNLGNLYNQIQQHQQALGYLTKAIQILQKNQAENMKLYLLVLQNTADCFLVLGKVQEGEDIYKNLFAIDESTTGKNSMQYAYRLLAYYAKTCNNLSKDEKRKKLNQILSIFKKNNHNDSAVVQELLDQLET